MNNIDRFEEYLRESLAKFDPVNVFYGVLIAIVTAVIFIAPWLSF